MKVDQILKEGGKPVIKAVWVDGSNTYYVTMNLENGRIVSSNQNRVPLCHSNYMFMRQDLNGNSAKRAFFVDELRRIQPTTADELANALRHITKLSGWKAA